MVLAVVRDGGRADGDGHAVQEGVAGQRVDRVAARQPVHVHAGALTSELELRAVEVGCGAGGNLLEFLRSDQLPMVWRNAAARYREAKARYGLVD